MGSRTPRTELAVTSRDMGCTGVSVADTKSRSKRHYERALVPVFLALAALIGLTTALSRPLEPVAAEVPSGFEVWDDDDNPVAEYEWVEVAGGDEDLYFGLNLVFPSDGQSGCIYIDVEYTLNAATTGGYFNYDAGLQAQCVGGGDGYGTAQGEVGPVEVDLNTDGTWWQWVEVVSPPHPQTLDVSGGGTVTVCTYNSRAQYPVSFRFRNLDGHSYVSAFDYRMMWHAEIDEPDEPPELCPDGFEVLSNTEYLPANGSWSDTAYPEWDKYWVRYSFTEPNTSGILHRLVMDVNEDTVTRQFYSDEVMEWDPEAGYLDTPFSWAVPNNQQAQYSDYDITSYAEGATATLSVASGYNPINLASVCIVPYYGPSELCPDGIEALSGGPVLLDALNGYWEADVPVTATDIVVRYSARNPLPSTVDDTFIPSVEYTDWLIQATLTAGEDITFTVPTSGVIKMQDESAHLEFYNRAWSVVLDSVCVINAADKGYIEQLDAETCHLVNPDFVGGVSGWSTSGSVSWDSVTSNGCAELSGGQVFQAVQTEQRRVWALEVRAKDDGGTTMTFGTDRTALIDGGAQTDTVNLASYFGIHTNYIYVLPGDFVYVESDGATIDSVCLVDDSDSLLGDFDCTFPEWDPEGSGDSLIIYVFHWLGDVLRWVVCEILRGVSILIGRILQRMKDLIYGIPMFPEPGSGLISWLEWFGLLFGDLLTWLGINIENIQGWIPRNINAFLRWLADIPEAFVFWLADVLGLDPYTIFDILDLIWNEAKLFWQEMLIEAGIEWDNALYLLQNMANVLIVLADGVRSGVSGNHVAYIGEDFSGIGGFIWTGVDFINEAVDMTPLSGLNILALGVIAWGLLVWTGKKFVKILESAGA